MIRKGISIKSIGDADWTSAWKIGEDDLKKLYGFMSIASVIVRQFLLPNPFECFGEKATLINWIAEPIIQMVAYFIVGLFYIKGAAPFWGSFAYLLFHFMMSLVQQNLARHSFLKIRRFGQKAKGAPDFLHFQNL